ncbi:ethylene insensitive protein [Medicago truncatula]|uniref:Ethylene insensitive protein n=1 Tax=Medicago truncatula TaxID=3880 RepID=G7I732_MEDTR|nr:ethylene insensitive protein [Medicago truncatula]
MVIKKELTIEELEARICNDKMLLKKMKEERSKRDNTTSLEQRKTKTMARAQERSNSQLTHNVNRYMIKMMEVCDARGFIYGVIPHEGKPMSGSSENLRGWWKDIVKFEGGEMECKV